MNSKLQFNFSKIVQLTVASSHNNTPVGLISLKKKTVENNFKMCIEYNVDR